MTRRFVLPLVVIISAIRARRLFCADNLVLDEFSITCNNGVAKTTGDMEEHHGGQVYMDIFDTGYWTVQVQELHRPRQDLLDVLLSSLLD